MNNRRPHNGGATHSSPNYYYGTGPYRNALSDVVPYEKYSKQHTEKQRVIHASKGSLPEQDLSKSLTDEENLYKVSEKNDVEQQKKRLIIRKCIFTAICVVFSLILNILSFRLPFTPQILTIDFSSFPELLACFAVHPLAALAVILVKNGIYALIRPSIIASIPYKVLLDTVFILITWALYRSLMKSSHHRVENTYLEYADLQQKDYSAHSILISGLAGSVITAVTSLLSFRYVLIPMFTRWLGDENQYGLIYESYRIAYAELTEHFQFIGNFLPTLDSLKVGVFIYNLPLTGLKYFCCVLITAAIYPFVRDSLNKSNS